MNISDEMAGVLARNCGEIKFEKNADGSAAVSFIFKPDLQGDSQDGIIFKQELIKMIVNMETGDGDDNETA